LAPKRTTHRETPDPVRRSRLTVEDICEDLGVSRRTFYEWRAKGTAPKCLKLPNGELRVSRPDYERWLEKREDAA
jgi:predicted DNA-binding transcriptional regulator AlpA